MAEKILFKKNLFFSTATTLASSSPRRRRRRSATRSKWSSTERESRWSKSSAADSLTVFFPSGRCRAYNRFYRADGTVVTDEKDIDEFAASFVPKDDIDAPIGE